MPGALAPLLVAVAWGLACPADAGAASEECGKSAKRWVAVRLLGPGFTSELAESVLTDLRAEVRRHGIDACPVDTPGLPPPIATMAIEASAPAILQLSLDITDPATGKRSARALQLDSMPLDGHSLAVAVAADELLTSSWIKLASRPPAAPGEPPLPAPAQPATEIAAAAAGPPREPTPPARYELAVLAATERFDGGAWNPGLDLALRRWLRPRWALELAAGPRVVVVETAAHGRVRSRALPIALRLLASLVPSAARARIGAAAALTAVPVSFSVTPNPGAVGYAQTGVAIYARGELWADVALGRFRARATAGAGLPLRSVTADDSGTAVGGARGIEWHGQAGLVVGW